MIILITFGLRLAELFMTISIIITSLPASRQCVIIVITDIWRSFVAGNGDILVVFTVVWTPRSVRAVTDWQLVALATDVIEPYRPVTRSVRVANHLTMATEI